MRASAMFDLGLSEVVFWELTPREYWYLAQRFMAAEERMDSRFKLIGSMVANFHSWYASVNRDPKARPFPFTADDFIPWSTVRRAQPSARRWPTVEELRTGISSEPMTPERMEEIEAQIAAAQAFTEAMSGPVGWERAS